MTGDCVGRQSALSRAHKKAGDPVPGREVEPTPQRQAGTAGGPLGTEGRLARDFLRVRVRRELAAATRCWR